MTPTTAYKVLLTDEMAALERDGRFAGSAIDLADGYIHLSTADQLTETADKHYAGRDGLHVVAVFAAGAWLCDGRYFYLGRPR